MGVNRRIDVNMTPFDKISRYLTSSTFPLISFYELATDYGIDPSFALATWIFETGNGTSDLWVTNNNPAGITCGSEYCSYNSQEQGFKAMFQLMRYYIDELNRNTVASVRALWSTSDDAIRIIEIMEEIYD